MKRAFLLLYLILAFFGTTIHGQEGSPTPTVPAPTATPLAEPTGTPAPAVAALPVPPTPPPAATPKSIKIGSGGDSLTLNFGSGDDDKKHNDDNDSDLGVASNVVLPIVAIAFVFGCPILIVALVLFYRMRKTRLLHQTIQNLVASGQPIPPELLISSGGKALPSSSSDRRNGIILCTVGLGLIGYFLAEGSRSWGVGFIPLAIGIGYLLTAKFAPRGKDASADKL